MKSSLLSGVFGAITAIMLAVFWQIVISGPIAAPPKRLVGANPSAGTANTTVVAKSTAMSPAAIVEAAFNTLVLKALSSANVTRALFQGQIPTPYSENTAAPWGSGELAQQEGHSALGANTSERELLYLKFFLDSKIPPPEKPAKIALDAMRHIPLGTPLEEIKRAADAFGVNYIFMKSVAKIESDFDPHERTGSYIGLFQLSRAEFKKYGSGDITNPRDNAIAAAYKFRTEAVLFEKATHKKPTIADLYLIHQQGWAGAAEQVSHPSRIAWKSMCATDEGKKKGERWCKRAIWGNTLPSVKHISKSVDHLTSGAFVAMWRDRVDDLYARYAELSVVR